MRVHNIYYYNEYKDNIYLCSCHQCKMSRQVQFLANKYANGYSKAPRPDPVKALPGVAYRDLSEMEQAYLQLGKYYPVEVTDSGGRVSYRWIVNPEWEALFTPIVQPQPQPPKTRRFSALSRDSIVFLSLLVFLILALTSIALSNFHPLIATILLFVGLGSLAAGLTYGVKNS